MPSSVVGETSDGASDPGLTDPEVDVATNNLNSNHHCSDIQTVVGSNEDAPPASPGQVDASSPRTGNAEPICETAATSNNEDGKVDSSSGMSVANEAAEDPPQSTQKGHSELQCVYCKAKISFEDGLLVKAYHTHLREAHNIRFQITYVAKRALSSALFGHGGEDHFKDVGVQVSAASREQLLVGETPGGRAAESSSAMTSTKTIAVAWYLGCQYGCLDQGCSGNTAFFSKKELSDHVVESHGGKTGLEEYKALHQNVFMTKKVTLRCLECGVEMTRCMPRISNHLLTNHNGMSLEEYRAKHNIPKEYEAPATCAKVDDEGDRSLKRKPSFDLNDSAPPTPKVPKLDEQGGPSNVKKVENINQKGYDSNEDYGGMVDIGASLCVVIDEEDTCEEQLKPTDHANNEGSSSSSKPWFSRCEYVCQVCQSCSFDDVTKLLFHLKNRHDNTSAKSYFSKYQQQGTVTRFYSCQVCNAKIKHQYSTIAKHLRRAHNIKMSKYTEIFHSQGAAGVDFGGYGGEYDGCDNDEGETEAQDFQRKQEMEKLGFESWVKGACKYLCAICKVTFSASTEIWGHAKNIHGLTVEGYKSEHGDPCVQMDKVECKGCSKFLRHDPGHLRKHAKMAHDGISLRSLYTKYFKPAENEMSTQTRVAESEFEERGGLMSEDAGLRFETDEIGGSIDNDGEPLICGGIGEGSGAGSVGMGDASDSRQGYYTWMNGGAVYTCKVCGHEFPGDTNLYNHIKSTHGMPYNLYKEAHGSSLTKRVMFECPKCHLKILHTCKYLTAHIKGCFNLKLFDFYRTFIAAKGDQSPHSSSMAANKEADLALNGKSYSDENDLDDAAAENEQEMSHKDPLAFEHDEEVEDNLLGQSGDNDDNDENLQKSFVAWTNASKLRCKICNKGNFLLPITLGLHIRKRHLMSKQEYKEMFSNDKGTKGLVKHVCKLCGTSISQNQIILAKHFKKHSISVFKYYEDYVFKPQQQMQQEQGSSQSLEPRTKSQDRQTHQEEPLQKQKRSQQTELGATPAAADGFDSWVNATIWGCKLCNNFKTNHYGPLIVHIEKSHNISKDDYKATFGNLILKKVMHRCKICGANLQQSFSSLTNHFKDIHNIGAREYYSQFVVPDKLFNRSQHQLPGVRSAPPPLSLKNLATPKASATSPLQKLPPLVKISDLERRLKPNVANLNLANNHPSSLLRSSSNGVRGAAAVPAQIGTNVRSIDGFLDWVNSCVFKCRICNFTTKKRTQLVSHLTVVHKMEVNDYKERFGTVLHQRVVHKCAFCKKSLNCYTENLCSHLKRHGVEPLDYYNRYVSVSSPAAPTAVVAPDGVVASLQAPPAMPKLKQFGKPQPFPQLQIRSIESMRQLQPLTQPQHIVLAPSASGDDMPMEMKKSVAWRWSSGCTYQCQVCGKIYNKSNSFYFHLKVSHNLFTEAYRAKYGDFRTTAHHTCMVCGTSIVHSSNLLRNHFKTHGGLTLCDYYWNYIHGTLSPEEQLKMTDVSVINDGVGNANFSGPFHRAMKEQQQLALQRQQDQLMGIVNDQQQQQQQVVGRDEKQVGSVLGIGLEPEGHDDFEAEDNSEHELIIEEPEMSSPYGNNGVHVGGGGVLGSGGTLQERAMQWASACIFNCKVCHKDYHRANSFYLHLRNMHSMSPDEYRRNFKIIRTTTVNHKCHVCGNLLVQTPCVMRKHFKIHKLSLYQYYEKFIQGGPHDPSAAPGAAAHQAAVKSEGFDSIAEEDDDLGDDNYGDDDDFGLVEGGGHGAGDRSSDPMDTDDQDDPLTSGGNMSTPYNRGSDLQSEALRWSKKQLASCLVCRQLLSRRTNLLKHVRNVHKMDVNQYRTQYEAKNGGSSNCGAASESNGNGGFDVIICKICQQTVVHSYNGLYKHFRRVHGTTIYEYYRIYVAPKESNFASDEDEKKTAASAVVKPEGNLGRNHPTLSAILGSSPATPTAALGLSSSLGSKAKLERQDNDTFKVKGLPSSVSIFKIERSNSDDEADAEEVVDDEDDDRPVLETVRRKQQNKSVGYQHHHHYPANSITPLASSSPSGSNNSNSVSTGNSRASIQPYSLWKDACQYRCKLCDFTTKIRRVIMDHIKNKHDMPRSVYIRHFGSIESLAVYHNCMICNVAILQDSTLLQTHIYHTHDKLNLKLYYDKYVAGEVQPDEALDESGASVGASARAAKNQNSSNNNNIHHHGPGVKLVATNASDVNKTPAWFWANGCEYKCMICSKAFAVCSSFYKHIKKTHGETSSSYQAKYKTLRSKTSFHACMVCGRVILHTTEHLNPHFATHNITLEGYYQTYVVSKLGVGGGGIPSSSSELQQPNGGVPVPNSETLLDSSKFGVGVDDIEIEVDVDVEDDDEEEGDVEEDLDDDEDMALENEAQNSDEESNERWMNQCLFKCRICDARLESKVQFCQHVAEEHDTSYDKYLDYHGNPMTNLKVHTCKMCNDSVTWDGEEIRTHLHKNHGISPAQYFAAHVENAQQQQQQQPATQGVVGSAGLSEAESSGKGGTGNPPSKSSKWDRCTEVCKICKASVAASDGAMYKHMAEAHGPEMVQHHKSPLYVDKRPKVVHECLICGMEVDMLRVKVEKHLATAHNGMSLKRYEDRFKDELDRIFEELAVAVEDDASDENQSLARPKGGGTRSTKVGQRFSTRKTEVGGKGKKVADVDDDEDDDEEVDVDEEGVDDDDDDDGEGAAAPGKKTRAEAKIVVDEDIEEIEDEEVEDNDNDEVDDDEEEEENGVAAD